MARTLPLLLTFLLMGVADAMGPLSSAVSANPFMAALMPFFVFIAFAVFSVPAGLLAARKGKKNLLLLGLVLCSTALAVPSFLDPPFSLLLAAVFLLGIGTTCLQVAANPLMRDVSKPGDYSRNLALAQGIKGLGSSSSAFLVTAVGSLSFLAAMGWRAAFPIFLALMLLALFAVSSLKVNETRAAEPPVLKDSLSLLREPLFARAVLGIFLYVGAEVCLATFLKPRLGSLGWPEKEAALFGPSMFFAALTLGRLLAGVVKAQPRFFFRISAVMGLLGLGLLLSGLPGLALPGVALAGLGCANIWPMLFSITVEARPQRAAELSGLMCMAISGGAVIPLLMGRLGGGASAWPFIVPAACFVYLLLLALAPGRKSGKAS